jgi:NRPS condensation-like uncharacterized protein
LLRYRTRFCRARKITPAALGDSRVSVSLHHLPDGIVPGLVAAAREQGATVNDVLLCAIANAVDRYGANPRTRGHDELALGTVVDLRAGSNQKMDDVFGLFLGITTTMLRQADLADWQRMLRAVSRQSAWQKRSKQPQASVLRMAVGLAEARLVSPRRWAELYRQRMPIAAAVSNVNMNRDWAGQFHPSPILDYFRVTPTGPLLPVIVAATTLGDKLNFLITRQTALIDDEHERLIAASISNRLIQLASAGRL